MSRVLDLSTLGEMLLIAARSERRNSYRMPNSAREYTPLYLQRQFRTQAFRVWLLITAVVLTWIALIVAAPIFNASPIYTFFSYICHQIPERSLHVAGHQMAVCSRCSGVYLGLLVGVVIYPLWRPLDETEPIARIWLFLSLIPITIDWSLTVLGIWENTHVTRLVTGLILGAACATFIVPALVDIARNLTSRRSLQS